MFASALQSFQEKIIPLDLFNRSNFKFIILKLKKNL